MIRNFFTFLMIFFIINTYSQQLPEGFAYVDEVIPDIIYDIRYAGKNNFTGRQVDGYQVPRAILSNSAAEALKNVQEDLIQQNYMLKVFDAYRPQSAVNGFVEWAKRPGDTLMKKEYYPNVPKSELFERGYIASKSGHSRGGTVDITLVRVGDCKNEDMGSHYDFFGEISHHNTNRITAEQKQNREKLRLTMRKHGFRSYSEEWWHYTFNAEPFPYTYFDFPIK